MFKNNKNMETNGSLQFKIALFVWLFLQWSVGTLASGNVTMESIQIFRTHEWFANKPMVYFRCQGENKIYLPDLKEKNHMYTFKGEESWQPLTALADRKCKRCGLYEEDKMTPDDIFDEWELCPDEFSPAPEGRYAHYKENEFNATFLCSQCNASDSGSTSERGITWPAGPISEGSGKSNYNSILGIVILCVSFIAVVGSAIVFYRVLQKRRREEEQARFLKLFEEDDLEAELGLKDEL